MLSKCICIISYFPDQEPLRSHRKESFGKLLKNLEQYFNLPIVIAAQNWREEDYKLEYSNTITVYSYKQQLGVTGARIKLQDNLLKYHNGYDYYIFLDDDSKLNITEEGVKIYFNEIEAHPNQFGFFRSIWWRLLAISNEMLHKTNYEYIKDLESIRGEVWEDYCWKVVWTNIYPNKWFNFSKKGIDDIFTKSDDDPDSLWFKKEFKNMYGKSETLSKAWLKHEKSKRGM